MARFWKSVGVLILVFVFGWYATDRLFQRPEAGEVLAIQSDRFAAVHLVPAESLGDRVRLFLTIRAGSADGGGNPAVAHYLEHLVFYNAKAGNLRDYQDNASTFEHSVTYISEASRSSLDTGIALLSGYFKPLSLKPDVFEREKAIIRREYASKRAEDPFYPGMHAHYRHLHRMDSLANSLESPVDIEHLTEQDARRIYEREYRQGNAVLTVMGDISPSALSRALEDSSLPRLDKAASLSIPAYGMAPPGVDVNRIRRAGIAGDQLFWSKIVPTPSHPPVEMIATRELAYEVLDSTLPGGLARPLRFDRRLASSFSLGLGALDLDHVMIVFSAVPDQGISVDTLRSEFEKTFADITRAGIPEDTFSQVKARSIATWMADEAPENAALERALDPIEQAIPPYSHRDYIAALQGVTHEKLDAFLSSLAAQGPVEVTYFEKD